MASLTLRQLSRDLGRIARGCAVLLRYLLTTDRLEIGLGEFSAESPVATRGRPNRYFVTISSVGSEPREVTLAIDIYTIDSPVHPGGHYAHFSKRMKVRPGCLTPVEVRYDWGTEAGFLIDGTPSGPDDLWKGTLDRITRYSVNAVLRDPRGTCLECLTVYQELPQ
jgi:hypothetical protein